jgi:hypothetical protein
MVDDCISMELEPFCFSDRCPDAFLCEELRSHVPHEVLSMLWGAVELLELRTGSVLHGVWL